MPITSGRKRIAVSLWIVEPVGSETVGVLVCVLVGDGDERVYHSNQWSRF